MLSLKSKITQAVLGYFMLHDNAELYVNEMARRFSVDDGNLARKLKELEQQGILKSNFKGKELYYSLDSSFPLLKEYKKIILKTVGFEEILKDSLRQLKGVEKAYLFGSYAEDKMDMSSDIDLVVVGNHSTIELQKSISEIQKSLDREINVISINSQEYQEKLKSDPFMKSVHRKKKISII